MAVNPNQVVSGFSLSQIFILNGATTFETAAAALTSTELRGARSGTLTLNTATFANTGNDRILDTWNSIDNATIAIESGYLDFAAISLLSGAPVTSTGSSPSDIYSITPWNMTALNSSAVPLLMIMRSKNLLKQARMLLIGVYAAEVGPLKITGPSYRTGLTISLEATASMSDYDEVGAPLADAQIIKILGTAAL